MADYLVISDERQKLIAKATKQDKTLKKLIKVIEQGCTYVFLVCSSAQYCIFVVAKTSFEVVFERETTVSCTNFLAVNDRYARRFSFVCVSNRYKN
jgi:hypothetical protein